MKKFLSFAVCLALVILTAISFAGCGKDKKEASGNAAKKEETVENPQDLSIIGKWNATIDISGSLKASLDLVNPNVAQYLEIKKVTSSITCTFGEDGTYSLTVNKTDALQKELKELEGGVSDALHKYLEKVIAAHGLSTTPEEMCLEQDGMTFEEEVADFIKKWDLSGFLNNINGVYEFDENTLHLGNETTVIPDRFFTVDLTSKTLKVTYYSQDTFGAYRINDIAPITFNKVK